MVCQRVVRRVAEVIRVREVGKPGLVQRGSQAERGLPAPADQLAVYRVAVPVRADAEAGADAPAAGQRVGEGALQAIPPGGTRVITAVAAACRVLDRRAHATVAFA